MAIWERENVSQLQILSTPNGALPLYSIRLELNRINESGIINMLGLKQDRTPKESLESPKLRTDTGFQACTMKVTKLNCNKLKTLLSFVNVNWEITTKKRLSYIVFSITLVPHYSTYHIIIIV